MTHPVPVAIDGLLAEIVGLGAALGGAVPDPAPTGPLAGVRLDDGDGGEFAEVEAVAVGLSTQEVSAADDQRTPRLRSDEHRFDILCTLQVRSGDSTPTTPAQLRTRAFALLDVIAARLDALKNLGRPEVFLSVRLDRSSYVQGVNEHGEELALIEFAIRVEAYRRR